MKEYRWQYSKFNTGWKKTKIIPLENCIAVRELRLYEKLWVNLLCFIGVRKFSKTPKVQ